MPKDGGPVEFMGQGSAAQSPFDVDKLSDMFRHRNTHWSIPEAFLCLLLSAALCDGEVTELEADEIRFLGRRSRVLSAQDTKQLATMNEVVGERMKSRPDALREACECLPPEMRMSVFIHCASITLADGALVRAEADFLNRISGHLKVEPADGKRVMEVLLIKNQY